MKLHPEAILIGDHTKSRLSWTLDQETARIESLAAETPELAELMAANGWTARSIAWGHVLHGFLEALDFDDEKGRT